MKPTLRIFSPVVGRVGKFLDALGSQRQILFCGLGDDIEGKRARQRNGLGMRNAGSFTWRYVAMEVTRFECGHVRANRRS